VRRRHHPASPISALAAEDMPQIWKDWHPWKSVTFNLTFEDGATFTDHQNNRIYTQSAKSSSPLWVLLSAVSLTKKSIEDTNNLP
jgi:hypothetical protein